MYACSSAAGLHVKAKLSLKGHGDPAFSHCGSTSGLIYFIIIIIVIIIIVEFVSSWKMSSFFLQFFVKLFNLHISMKSDVKKKKAESNVDVSHQPFSFSYELYLNNKVKVQLILTELLHLMLGSRNILHLFCLTLLTFGIWICIRKGKKMYFCIFNN